MAECAGAFWLVANVVWSHEKLQDEPGWAVQAMCQTCVNRGKMRQHYHRPRFPVRVSLLSAISTSSCSELH
jgi:hypothetical protein